jgi:poly-gamma-glutamate capsule biosynthesis protein CapA/YwtB (metallophosphatase superfamily)
VLLALAGDTMLGRGVAEALSTSPPCSLVAREVAAFAARADLFLLNLECCISERGDPWPSPGKPFFFRAPPQAIDLLTHLGVDCVTLANNHALDYGVDALGDTLGFLDSAGIVHVGAGMDQAEARRPAALDAAGSRVEVLGIADHPSDFAAGVDRPGIALADLRRAVPDWVLESVRASPADVVVVTPHWGPNMATDPVPHVRHAAQGLVDAGASLVAGHSAHVFHGVSGGVLYDLGDFLDDYAVDPVLRNDLGLLWLVDLDRDGIHRIEALPLRLDFCHTRRASGEDAAWIRERFRKACAAMGTEVEEEEDGCLVISPPEGPRPGGRAGRSAGRNAPG